MATIAFGLVVWVMRRPDQLLHPYVWAEEYKILDSYQTNGLVHAIVVPVNGYFLWPTSFTVGFAAAVSFLHVPLIEYWLTTAWFVATLVLILVPASSLRLRWRVGFATLLVLAPMNPEVYGIALYIFWWTTLWPLISIIWTKDYWGLRIPVLVIGGMSSLAGAAMVVPYALVFALTRRRRYLAGTLVLGAASLAQAITYFNSSRSQHIAIKPYRIALQELHNFSYYAFAWLKPTNADFLSFTGACILVGLLGVVTFRFTGRRTEHTHQMVALVVGLLVVGVLSSVSVPLLTTPSTAGPRYYFLPYVVMGWVLLMIGVSSEFHWARLAAAALTVMSLFALSVNFSRHDDRVSWSEQLGRCRTASGPFFVPVQVAGARSRMWTNGLVITPQTCRRLGYG